MRLQLASNNDDAELNIKTKEITKADALYPRIKRKKVIVYLELPTFIVQHEISLN